MTRSRTTMRMQSTPYRAFPQKSCCEYEDTFKNEIIHDLHRSRQMRRDFCCGASRYVAFHADLVMAESRAHLLDRAADRLHHARVERVSRVGRKLVKFPARRLERRCPIGERLQHQPRSGKNDAPVKNAVGIQCVDGHGSARIDDDAWW